MNRIEKWDEIRGAEQEMMEAFLESRTDSYAILQLRDMDETRQERFASLDYLHRQGKDPDIDHYEIVYTADLPTFTDRDVMLESIYTKFNMDHPADFTGHSLSVSDIVALTMSWGMTFGTRCLNMRLEERMPVASCAIMNSCSLKDRI